MYFWGPRLVTFCCALDNICHYLSSFFDMTFAKLQLWYFDEKNKKN